MVFSRFSKPSTVKKDGTTLCELQISNIADAHYVAGLQPYGFTPVVLVPSRSMSLHPCCKGWYQEIPEGFQAIVVRLGKDMGVYEPGLHWMPPWQHTAYLVTRQMVVFDTPVKDCKTADNVTVNLDVMILFGILDGQKFVYNLGPEKLDGLMRAAQEEALRSMASSVTADRVLELQGSNTENIVEEMNLKFIENYGVKIYNMTVKNVRLPPDLMSTLQKKTIFVSKEIESVRQQELKVMIMTNEAKLQKLDEELVVEKSQAEEQYVTSKARMDQEIAGIKSTTDKEISGVKAESHAKQDKARSACQLELARLRAEKDQLQRDVALKVAEEKRNIMAEATGYVRQKTADTNYLIAENRAKALDITAEAEGYAAEGFKAKRDFDVARERLLIYEKLASNKNVTIASSTENIMGLAPRNDAVTQVVQKAIQVANVKLTEMGASIGGVESPSRRGGSGGGGLGSLFN